jgi:4-amino-4-deoxy-L-arabinose transferase-like glycosyltransferase
MPRYRIIWILALALIPRLVHIHAPVIGMHAWRQADTAAIARNYYEGGFRFGHPQVDWGGATNGEIECEFPAYPFAIACLYKLFGPREAAARGLSILGSLVMIAAMYALVRRTDSERTALWAAFLLAVLPLSIYYGRTIMPESWMLAFSALGILFLLEWRSTDGIRGTWPLLVSAGLVSAACLLKIPCLYLGLPLIYVMYSKLGSRFLARWEPWVYAALVLTPVAIWYRHAHGILARTGLTFGIWEYGSDKWGNWGLVATAGFWNKILFKSLAERHLTWAGFILLLIGLFLKRRSGRERLYDFWAAGLLVYLLIVTRGNFVHEYYQLPFLLPFVVFMARPLARFAGLERPVDGGRHLRRGRFTIGLAALVIAVLSLSASRLEAYWKKEAPSRSAEYALAERIRAATAPADRIIALDFGDPTLLYLAHRKGWNASPSFLTRSWLEARTAEGAACIAGFSKDLGSGPFPLDSLRARDSLALDNGGFIVRLGGRGGAR